MALTVWLHRGVRLLQDLQGWSARNICMQCVARAHRAALVQGSSTRAAPALRPELRAAPIIIRCLVCALGRYSLCTACDLRT